MTNINFGFKENQFLVAVSKGDEEFVKNYLKNGGDLTVIDKTGEIAKTVFIPKEIGWKECWLEASEVNSLEPCMNALQIAFYTKNNNIVSILLSDEKVKQIINAVNRFGEAILHHACEKVGSENLITELLKNGAQIDLPTTYRSMICICPTPLAIAAKNDNIIAAKLLLEQEQAFILNEIEAHLILAVAQVVQSYVGSWIVDQSASHNKFTPLFYAIQHKSDSTDMVKLLLDRGADPMQKCEGYMTGKQSLVQYLESKSPEKKIDMLKIRIEEKLLTLGTKKGPAI